MTIFSERSLDALPALSRAHVLSLTDRRAADVAAAQFSSNQLFDARDRENNLRREFHRRISGGMPDGTIRRVSSDDIEAVETDMRPKFKAVEDEIARLADAHSRAKDRLTAWGFLDAAALWADDAVSSRATLVFVDPPSPSIKNGDYTSAVADIRHEIDRLDAEYAEVKSAPDDPSDLKGRIAGEINLIAERGRPEINFRSRGPSPVGLEALLSVRTMPGANQLVGDGGAAFIVYAMRPELLASLFAEVDHAVEAGAFEGALTYDQRERRLGELAETKLEAERREEAIIQAAEVAGFLIARRPGVDPRAVLMVEDL